LAPNAARSWSAFGAVGIRDFVAVRWGNVDAPVDEIANTFQCLRAEALGELR